MDIEKILDEMKDLLHVPDIGLALYHRIEELKITMSKNIRMFQSVTESLNPQKSSLNKDIDATGTDFELSLIGENTWIPSLPDNPGRNGYEVVPQQVIDHIINSSPGDGVISMFNGIRLPKISNRVFDLNFEKTGDNKIFGTITEHVFDVSGLLLPDNVGEKAKFNAALPENAESSERHEKLKCLLSYMLMDEGYLDAAYEELCSLWKPMIDKKKSRQASAE